MKPSEGVFRFLASWLVRKEILKTVYQWLPRIYPRILLADLGRQMKSWDHLQSLIPLRQRSLSDTLVVQHTRASDWNRNPKMTLGKTFFKQDILLLALSNIDSRFIVFFFFFSKIVTLGSIKMRGKLYVQAATSLVRTRRDTTNPELTL